MTLKSGSFKTRVTQGRFDVLFTPDISWNTLVQYDNVSDSIGINTRLRWIFTPGRELFLVFNQSLEDDGGRIRRARSESLVKLAWTFRF